MIKINRFLRDKVLAVMLIGIMVVAVYGQDSSKPVAEEMINSSGITWVPKLNYSQLVLTISRPDGTVFRKTFDSGGSPYVDLSSIFGDSYQDGSYTYQLVVIPVMGNKSRNSGQNYSSKSSTQQNQKAMRITQSGGFTIRDGGIVTSNFPEPSMGSTGTLSGSQEGLSRTMDQVIADDLIVQMSACVGVDCVNNENFGFDTLRLKENNLRIHFNDTSNSGSFPSNDWRIVINDTSNGGSNYFAVEDSDGGKQSFKLMAGAPNNSIYVNSSGNVGFGTSSPVLDLHVANGNTPAMRLEQDGSSGFTAQTWDVAGNETNFFVRDVSHGSKLPFKIRPSSPDNMIVIEPDGVGIGTGSPSYQLHVNYAPASNGTPGIYLTSSNGNNPEIHVANSTGATTYMSGGSNFGFFGTRSNHPLRFAVNGGFVMEINSSGNYINMVDGGSYNGTWNNGSSREIKENIENLTLDEAMNALEGLTPVKYNYKANKDEPRLGFIAEDVPELVAMNDRKNLSSMDIVAVLTKVVQKQHEMAVEQQKTINELKEKVAELEKRTH